MLLRLAMDSLVVLGAIGLSLHGKYYSIGATLNLSLPAMHGQRGNQFSTLSLALIYSISCTSLIAHR